MTVRADAIELLQCAAEIVIHPHPERDWSPRTRLRNRFPVICAARELDMDTSTKPTDPEGAAWRLAYAVRSFITTGEPDAPWLPPAGGRDLDVLLEAVALLETGWSP